jgi:uncharacterized membrane protein
MTETNTTAASQTFEQWRMVLLSNWDWPFFWLAIGVAAFVVLLALRSTRRQRWSVRLGLVSLRALAVGLLLLTTLQPGIRRESVTQLPNRIAILLDLSRSMAIREQANAPSRIERSLALLEASEGQLERWRARRHVDFYGYHQDLVSWTPSQGPRSAIGTATRTRSALEQLRERYRGSDLAGVVLISDGIDNGRLGEGTLSQVNRRFLVRLETPIHTVRVGGDDLRDIAVGPVHADDFAFVRNAVKVDVEVRATGVEKTQVPLTLREGERLVARRQVELDSGKGVQRVSFEFVPQRVGKYVYTVSTPLIANEAVESNNSESFMLQVIRDRVRVLQVCGRPSWDERFLRRMLKRDPNIDLISFFILRTPASLALVPRDELSLIPFPTEELFDHELGSFDLVILQNFNYGPYGIGAYLPRLRQYVERGGGLAMLGGELSFTSGGYHGTVLADVLPVHLSRPTPVAEKLLSADEFKPLLTERGREHPLLQLGRDGLTSSQIVAGLPPLVGSNVVGRARRGAVVLATHPRLKTRSGNPMPVLAVREVGKGRTLALTSDSLWRWAFVAVGEGGTRQAYDRIWRGMIRWLIKDPELEYLRIVVQRDRVRKGGEIHATIRAYHPDYRPATDVQLRYSIEPVAGGEAQSGVLRTDELGEARLTYRATTVGAFRVRAEATIGERRAVATDMFLVHRASLEEQNPQATGILLEELASASGGRYLGPVEELPDLPFLSPRVRRVNWTRDSEIWNQWWFLCFVVGAFALEWSVRRRFGHF